MGCPGREARRGERGSGKYLLQDLFPGVKRNFWGPPGLRAGVELSRDEPVAGLA
jgi:hypothetical protein